MEDNMNTITDIDRLAADLDQYALDRDPYAYHDNVDSREESVEQIREQLESGKLPEIREFILQDLEEMEGSADPLRETAETLITRLDALIGKYPGYMR
jgi:hypothetical protein